MKGCVSQLFLISIIKINMSVLLRVNQRYTCMLFVKHFYFVWRKKLGRLGKLSSFACSAWISENLNCANCFKKCVGKINWKLVIYNTLADLGGAPGTHPPPPYGCRFFCFDMQNFWNIAASGVHGPPYEVHAPLREILDPPLQYTRFFFCYFTNNSLWWNY